MSTSFKAMRMLPAAIMAAALGGVGGLAVAAPATQPDASGHASKVETVTISHVRTPFQRDALVVSQKVGYSDLDLATSSGANELTSRIEQAAARVCDRLEVLDPSGSIAMKWSEQRVCVDSAIGGAMKEARVAIAGAQERQGYAR